MPVEQIAESRRSLPDARQCLILQPNHDDAGRERGRVPEDVREIAVERDQCPPLSAGYCEKSVILGTGEVFVTGQRHIMTASR